MASDSIGNTNSVHLTSAPPLFHFYIVYLWVFLRDTPDSTL